MDISHTEDGYVMISYDGGADRVQVQITNPDGSRNPYPLEKGDYRALPLTGGNGTYLIEVLAHVSGGMYSTALSKQVSVQLADEFSPFLYPNQYCLYDRDSKVVAQARKLSKRSSDDEEFITRVFKYVTKNIEYDNEFAKAIPVNYLPNPDETMKKKKGICLDYASLMTAMLRSQGMPTKLEVGYAGEEYHAWISVYVEGKGWIDHVIELSGDTWTLVDPTLAAGNDRHEAAEYMEEDENYTVKYNY